MDNEQALALSKALIRMFEGLRLSPYLCSAGVPTIGYGATFYEDGTLVRLTDQPITKDRAESLLDHQLKTVFFPSVIKLCPGATSQPGRLAALVDFAFNLGTGRLRSSTLLRKSNRGEWEETPSEFRKWVNGGGKRLAGLVKRREAEILLLGVRHGDKEKGSTNR